MKMHALRGLGALIIAAALAGPAEAQIGVEARVGGAIGNHTPAYAGLETIPGPSLAGSLEYRLHRAASVYATYATAAFGCTEGFCTGRDATIRTRGYGGGLRLHPSRLPWIRAGGAFFDAEVVTEDGSTPVEPRPGFEIGTGITIPLATRLRLLPGAYVRTQLGEERTTLVGADLGIQLAF